MNQETREVVQVENTPEAIAKARRAGLGILVKGPFFTNRKLRRTQQWQAKHVVGEKVRKIAARKAKEIRTEKRRAKR